MFRTLIFFLLIAGSVSAEQWNLSDTRWGFQTDSVWLKRYVDGSIVDSARKTTVQSWDTTLTAQEGALTQAVYFIYYWGQSTPLAWTYERNLKRNATGEFDWRLVGAYFPATTDSAYLVQLRDTTTLDTATYTSAPTDMDTTLTAYAASYNTANILIWYTGEDSATTWSWVWDLTDTTSGGNISLPGVPDQCRIYGTVMDADGTRVQGAIVCAVRRSGDNATGDAGGGANVIMTGAPTCKATDANGYFEMYLVGTSQYADTTRGFYDITCDYGGVRLFTLPAVWVPSSGIWNVADTLSLRRQ